MGDEDLPIYFKLEWTIRQLSIPRRVDFSLDGPHCIDVSLRAPTDDEQKLGHDKANAFCIATSQQDVNADIRAMFDSLNQDKLPPGSKQPETDNHIDQQANIERNYVPPIELMPQSFQSFAQQVYAELSDHARRTVKVLRWRCAWAGPHNPVSSRGLSWSFDDQIWKWMPGGFRAYGEVVRAGGPVSSKVHAEIESLVKQGVTEPVGHELFREAWEQRHQNPRSALVIGIAAAEVGFKELVVNLVPQASWLIEELPSPPLIRMLKEYLPELPTRNKIRGSAQPPPPEILKALEVGISLRNKIAHTRAPPPSYEKLEKILLAVKDLLWILDYYNGFDWAFDEIRQETRNIL